MKATYQWLARLIAIGVVLQAAFVAYGTFEVLNKAEDGRPFTTDTEWNVGQMLHSVFGTMVIPLLSLILLIIAFFAKIAGGVKFAAIIFGLVVLQILLGIVAFSAPVVGTLHAINAFAMAGVAGFAGRKASQSMPVAGSAATV